MGLYHAITSYIRGKTKTNPNAAIVFGADRVQVSMDTNQAGTTMASREMQRQGGARVISLHPLGRQLLMRYDIMVGELKGDVAESMSEQSAYITYDKYTESILAEMMSSQQIESRLESAPRFIRPKKKEKIIYQ
jgi:hypothetical protein